MRNLIRDYFPTLLLYWNFPALLAWIALMTGIAIRAYLPISHQGTHLQFYPYGYICAIALISGIIIRSQIFRIVLFLCAGYCLYSEKIMIQREFFTQFNSKVNISVEGTTCGRTISTFQGYLVELKISKVESGQHQLLNKFVRLITTTELAPGLKCQISGTFIPPRVKTTPLDFDEYSYFMAEQIWGKIEADSVRQLSSKPNHTSQLSMLFMQKSQSTIQAMTSYDNRTLLEAAFLNEKQNLSKELKDLFRKTGIYHLLAISGLHTSILFAALFFFVTMFPLTRTAKFLIAGSGLWAYALFIGPVPSLIRAVLMATTLILCELLQKKSYGLQSLGIAGCIWLLFSPESLFQPGYQLSFAATAGIMIVYPFLKQWLPEKAPNKRTFLLITVLQPIFISIAAFLFTTPILLYHFGKISLIGLLISPPAVVAMTAAMWCFFVALIASLLVAKMAYIIMILSNFCFSSIVQMAKLTESLPFSEIALPSLSTPQLSLVALLLLLLCTIEKSKLKKTYSWVLPLFLSLLFAISLSTTRTKTLEIIAENKRHSSLQALILNSSQVWLIAGGTKKSLENHVESFTNRFIQKYPSLPITYIVTPDNNQLKSNPAKQVLFTGKNSNLPSFGVSPETVLVPADACSLQFCLRNAKWIDCSIRQNQYTVKTTQESLISVDTNSAPYISSSCYITIVNGKALPFQLLPRDHPLATNQ